MKLFYNKVSYKDNGKTYHKYQMLILDNNSNVRPHFIYCSAIDPHENSLYLKDKLINEYKVTFKRDSNLDFLLYMFFDTEEDAQGAVDFLESIIIVNKLSR